MPTTNALFNSQGKGQKRRRIALTFLLSLLSIVLLAGTFILGVTHFAHAAPSSSNIAYSIPTNKQWYFAEGGVGGSYQEYLTLMNVNATQTSTVSVTYIEPTAMKTLIHSVSPNSRTTISVNNDLGVPPNGTYVDVATIIRVTNGPAIVAERPIYVQNVFKVSSGTDVLGETTPQTSYYFSEGDDTQSGTTFNNTIIYILNPSSSLTDTVNITYYCPNTGKCKTDSRTVGPLTCLTLGPSDVGLNGQFAMQLTSDNPMVVENALFFDQNIPNAGGTTTGEAATVGAHQTQSDWLFAEGYTGSNFQEYFNLANFGLTAAHVNIQLEYTNGGSQTLPVTVPAAGLYQFDVNKANANPTGTCNPSPCVVTADVSAEITSDQPIVADRLMYFHYGTNKISGVTDVIGKVAPPKKNYSFAEGYTAGSYHEYLTLQNPTTMNETVTVNFFLQKSPPQTIKKQYVVTAHSRQTVDVNAVVNAVAPGGVSMTVVADEVNALIVAERPMYFIFTGNGANDPGGTDIIGYSKG